MSVIYDSGGGLSASPGNNLAISIVGGSQVAAVAYSNLPAASAGNAGQIYQITDFGYPYVMVQSTGSTWKQLSNFYCAWASLPSATTFAGFIGYTKITGIGSFRVESRQNASSIYKWRPITPVHIFTFNDDTGTTIGPINPANEMSIYTGPVLPADFIQIKDRFELQTIMLKGGTTVSGAGTIRVRMGINDTPTSDSALFVSTSSTSNVVNYKRILSYIASDTKCRTANPQNVSGTNDAAGSPATATLDSISANAKKLFLTLQPGGTAETLTMYHATLILHPGV